MKPRFRYLGIILLGSVLLLLASLGNPNTVRAQTSGIIVLDSLFDDWIGQPCISDPVGDQTYGANTDLTNFCFATNPNEDVAYFMAERRSGTNRLRLLLVMDTNRDGYLTDVDRIVRIDYLPQSNGSDVSAIVYDGDGNGLWLVTYGDTGESIQEGGRKVEWGLPFYTLGIQAGQTVDMYLSSVQTFVFFDAISDSTDIVTWTPADALGPVLLGVLVLAGVLWFTYIRKRARTEP